MEIIKKVLSFGFVKYILVLVATYLIGQSLTAFGNEQLGDIAFVLIVGIALIINAIDKLKQ